MAAMRSRAAESAPEGVLARQAEMRAFTSAASASARTAPACCARTSRSLMVPMRSSPSFLTTDSRS